MAQRIHERSLELRGHVPRVAVRAADRLGDDLVDQPERLQAVGGDAQRLGGLIKIQPHEKPKPHKFGQFRIPFAQLGKRVAIVEQSKLGGACLNRGCVPMKSLLSVAKTLKDVRKNIEPYGVEIIRFGEEDVVRHPLVQRIVAAYEEHRGKTKPE